MIFQINLFICESCGYTSTTSEETASYSDPVVTDPPGEEWGYIGEMPHEKHVCPKCIAANARPK